MTDIETWQRRLARPASLLSLDLAPAVDDPLGSWFRKVAVGGESEEWLCWRGEPLEPLCQINLAELPARPAILADTALITLFISQHFYEEDCPSQAESGHGGALWCLRTYASLDGLRPLAMPEGAEAPRCTPIAWALVEADYPTHDLLPVGLPEDLREAWYELGWAECHDGTKVGGWPSCIQSEPWWDYRTGGREFEFAFQIDSLPKLGWMWGDSGTGYFARSREQPNVWAFDWQCY